MEAAATRAVHADPVTAARALIEVLDHWDRVGDWSQQWLNLRYVTRFLVRVGAVEDAAALHHALIAAGRLSPLAPADVDIAEASEALSGAEAVGRARSSLAGTAEACQGVSRRQHAASFRCSPKAFRPEGHHGHVGGRRPGLEAATHLLRCAEDRELRECVGCRLGTVEFVGVGRGLAEMMASTAAP